MENLSFVFCSEKTFYKSKNMETKTYKFAEIVRGCSKIVSMVLHVFF